LWQHPGDSWLLPLPLGLLPVQLLLQLLQLLLLHFQVGLLFLHLCSHVLLLPSMDSLEPGPSYGSKPLLLSLLLAFGWVLLHHFGQPLSLHIAA
jgi:hypothetical protein